MKLTGELLEMEPDNSRLIGNMKIYRCVVLLVCCVKITYMNYLI